MAPAILAPLALGASALSGVIGAMGAMAQGKSAEAMYNYRAAMARNQAAYARQAGDVAAENQGYKVGQILGAQRAAQGASGLDVGSQSFANVADTTSKMGRLDELTVRYNAEIKALSLENEATLDEAAAKNAKSEGLLKVASSILGGVTSVSDKWLNYKRVGLY